MEGQLSLFNEAKTEADVSVPKPITKEVKGYVRKDSRARREEIIKDLPVREILCETTESERYCDQCNSKLGPLGKEVVREELKYIPAKFQIVSYVRVVYECPRCKYAEHPFIRKALTLTFLMSHSLVSPSSVANVMYQKNVNSVPLYRQEKDWERMGLSLARSPWRTGSSAVPRIIFFQ